MKSLPVQIKMLALSLALALVQFACGFGAGPASPNQPQTPAGNPPPAATSEHGTADEAKSMLKLAIEHYNSAGREKALADFTAGAAPFKDRDLYVVCMDSNHIETANGGFPQYVGASADSLTDQNGVPLGQAIWAAASTDSINSVDYHWVNPVSGQTEPKKLFFQKVGTDVCGVGVYSP